MPKFARTQVINIPKLLEPPDLPTLLKTSKPVIETEDFKLFADPGTIALIIEATAAIAGFYKAVSGAKTADALKNIEKQLQKISEQLAAIDQKLNRILYEIAKLGVKIDEGFAVSASAATPRSSPRRAATTAPSASRTCRRRRSSPSRCG